MTAKVWEETWTTDESETQLIANEASYEASYFAEGGSHSCARIRLASAAPDMARVLLAVEWEATWVGDHPSCCPSCYGAKPDTYVSGNVGGVPASELGHKPDCALDAALRKAGVR